jgi:ABC-type uncharacterized transport system involved in gliding motility auxiliary subunit
MDISSLALPYRDPATGQLQLMRYPPWVGVLTENANRESVLTSGFGGVDLYWTSPLTLTLPESGNVKGEAIFTSTPQAWLMSNNFEIRPESSYMFGIEKDLTTGAKILGVTLEGNFPGWFAGQPKPDEEGRPPLPDMPAESKPSRIAVIGDSDMPGMLVQYTQSQRNVDFILQTADWLGNDDDIVGIRNRSGGTGRLDRITDPAKRLSKMTSARIINIVIIPLAIIVTGVIRATRRRSGKERKDES